MRTKALWSTVSVLVAAALLIVSCGPRAAAPTPTPAPAPAPTPTPATPTPTPAPTPAPVASPILPAEKPKYGGSINVIVPTFLDKFDIAVSPG